MKEEKLDDLMASGIPAAIEAGKEIGSLKGVRVIDVAGVPHVIMPRDIVFDGLEGLLPQPTRLRENRVMVEMESFVAYVERWKSDATHLFGEVLGGDTYIKAELDYHADPDKPSHCEHTCRLNLRPSPEWAAFTSMDKQKLSQRAFAEFLEENISSIAEPAAKDVLVATRAFTTRRTSVIDTAVDGPNVSFALSDEVQGTTRRIDVTLPQRLVLGLRPFKRSAAFKVDAVLRFHHNERGTDFSYALIEPEKVVEAAFNEIRADVEKATGLAVHV